MRVSKQGGVHQDSLDSKSPTDSKKKKPITLGKLRLSQQFQSQRQGVSPPGIEAGGAGNTQKMITSESYNLNRSVDGIA